MNKNILLILLFVAGCGILEVPCTPEIVEEEVIYVEDFEITTVERTDLYEECVLLRTEIGPWRLGYPSLRFTYECRCER